MQDLLQYLRGCLLYWLTNCKCAAQLSALFSLYTAILPSSRSTTHSLPAFSLFLKGATLLFYLCILVTHTIISKRGQALLKIGLRLSLQDWTYVQLVQPKKLRIHSRSIQQLGPGFVKTSWCNWCRDFLTDSAFRKSWSYEEWKKRMDGCVKHTFPLGIRPSQEKLLAFTTLDHVQSELMCTHTHKHTEGNPFSGNWYPRYRQYNEKKLFPSLKHFTLFLFSPFCHVGHKLQSPRWFPGRKPWRLLHSRPI